MIELQKLFANLLNWRRTLLLILLFGFIGDDFSATWDYFEITWSLFESLESFELFCLSWEVVD